MRLVFQPVHRTKRIKTNIRQILLLSLRIRSPLLPPQELSLIIILIIISIITTSGSHIAYESFRS